MKKAIILLSRLSLIAIITVFSGCKDDDPEPENIPELITKVILRFTPAGGTPVVVTATDPDGEGSQNLQIDGPINLTTGTTYTLSVELINGLYNEGEDGYDITEEVREEGDEHQLFFSWTDGAFSSPTGAGNIGAPGLVNYDDEDADGRPIGLTTTWATSATTRNQQTFRVLLKHQPDIKSNASSSIDGETDLDITFFPLNIN
jgi:hypothetical protein